MSTDISGYELTPQEFILADEQVSYSLDPKMFLLTVLAASIIVATIMGRVSSNLLEVSGKPVEGNPVPHNITSEFVAPYDNYVITQGLHGFSYGHMAIDLSGGKGSEVRSPISGLITERYIDYLGNTTLIIENELYRVIILHGEYTVDVGDYIESGQPVGRESNRGYTTDLQGNFCGERDCGYHSHLNVYDKVKGENINPIDLLNH